MDLEIGAASALAARQQDNALDQRAQRVPRGGARGAAAGERAAEILDPRAIGLDHLRMERDDVLALDLRQLGAQRIALGRGGGDRVPYRFGLHAALDRLDEPRDLRVGARDAALDRGLAAGLALRGLDARGMVFADIFGDELGREQPVAQRAEDAALEFGVAHRRAVGAAAGLARLGAAPCVARQDRHPPPAFAAFEQSAEQPPRPAELVRGLRRAPLEPGARGGEGRLVDDAQLGHLAQLPLALGIGARDAAARVGIAHEALAVVDDAAGIEIVPQDAVAARAVAGDRAGAPQPAARRGNALGIERVRDLGGAEPGGVIGEDAADDFGLVLADPAQPALGLAAIVERSELFIAVGDAAGDAPGMDAADLAAARLVGEIAQEQRRHRALEPDMDLLDLALGEGDEPRPGEAQALPDGGDVLLVARDAVERFGEHDVEARSFGEQAREAGPIAHRAGDGGVGEARGDLPALALGTGGAQAQLVLGRGTRLAVSREAGVDRGAHRASCHGAQHPPRRRAAQVP